MLDFTSDGNHSCAFHAPDTEPVIWPTRTETAGKPLSRAAMLRIVSETHFDSL